MWLSLSVVSLIGGLICLDRVFIEAMISRPIVAGPLIGFILHDPYTGLLAGALIELLWIDKIPTGVSVAPNDSLVAILITAGAIFTGRETGIFPRDVVPVAALFFLPTALIGRKIEIWIRTTNNALSQKAIIAAQQVDLAGIARQHKTGILKYYLSTVMLICISLIFGFFLMTWLFPRLPAPFLNGVSYVHVLLPALGTAAALATIKVRGTIPVFSGVVLMITVITEIF